MRRRRLFVEELPAAAAELSLPLQSARHSQVLRLRDGEAVRLFDGRGREADAVLTSVGRGQVRCRSEAAQEVSRTPPRVVLLVGLSKGAKLDGIVRMGTELGLAALRPVVCERSVARPGDPQAKRERLERIALSACAQSGAAHAPQLHAATGLAEAAALAPPTALRLVLDPEAPQGLLQVAGAGPAASEAWAVVGPEGGLTSPEIQRLGEQGYRRVGLGPRTLRVETAAPVVVALLQEGLRMGYPAGS